METIYESLPTAAKIRKIVKLGGCFVILLEKDGGGEGVVLSQHSSGYYDHAPFNLPPDTLGLEVVDVIENQRNGNPSLLFSDGSVHERGQHDERWLVEHGYMVCRQTMHVVDPSNNVWQQEGALSRRRGNPSGRMVAAPWMKVATLPGRPLTITGDSLNTQHAFALMQDGEVIPIVNDASDPLSDFKITPWSDEGLRFKDIVSGRMSVTGITTDGRVITHMMVDHNHYWADRVYWPLPDGCIAESFDNRVGPCVKMADGRTVFYTVKEDWDGKKGCPVTGDFIPYPSLIRGVKRGDWIGLIGSMIAFNSRWGLDRQAPPGIRIRSAVKTAKLLGEL